MQMFDEKKAVMTILRKRSEAGETPTSSPMKNEIVKTEDGELDGRHLAAQDMIAAFHEKSPERLMQAMSNFNDLHSMKAPAAE